MRRVKVMQAQTFSERIDIGVERGFDGWGYVVPDLREYVVVGGGRGGV
jgi:hypothetical protein